MFQLMESPSAGETSKILAGSRQQGMAQSGLYTFIVGAYAAVIVISTGMAAKFFTIGGMSFNGSILAWPLTFVFNDIFTEVYGYERSRQIIWTGLFVCMFTAVMYGTLGLLPAAPFWHQQEAYASILGQAPRIVAAGLMSYFWGEYTNSVMISRLKFMSKGKTGRSQCTRFVVSTAVGELVDTLIFYPLAFVGVIPLPDLLQTMVFIYFAKVGYEILALPISVKITNYIKQRENIDVLDDPSKTDYTPVLHLS
jgi:queuosine precursor transporter